MRKARIGLILDQGLQDWRVKDFIEKSFDSKSYKIECLIIQNSYEHQSSKPSNLLINIFFKQFYSLKSILLGIYSNI